MAREDSWETKGLCKKLGETDAKLRESFYGDTTAQRKAAKALCAECPVRLACLSDALNRQEVWGVWGGCDEVDLRRALWTNTNGTERDRLRFPRCPACHARSECLFVSAACVIRGRAEEEEVECGSCSFSWTAKSSVAAVKAFWAQQTNMAVVIPIKKPAKVRVPRGRIPSERPNQNRRVVQLQAPTGSPAGAMQGLAASGRPQSS